MEASFIAYAVRSKEVCNPRRVLLLRVADYMRRSTNKRKTVSRRPTPKVDCLSNALPASLRTLSKSLPSEVYGHPTSAAPSAFNVLKHVSKLQVSSDYAMLRNSLRVLRDAVEPKCVSPCICAEHQFAQSWQPGKEAVHRTFPPAAYVLHHRHHEQLLSHRCLWVND